MVFMKFKSNIVSLYITILIIDPQHGEYGNNRNGKKANTKITYIFWNVSWRHTSHQR
jgi:hypothetical protein